MKNYWILIILSLFFVNCKTQKTVQAIANEIQTKPVGLTEPQKRNYWQQQVNYKMDIDIKTKKHQYHGVQQLVYTNHSPDTLYSVYYHLYWNAFQPGSAMDWRARSISDPDRNLDKLIKALKPDEMGFIKINSLTQDNQIVEKTVVGTILSVKLNKPILPGESTTFQMDYLAQVPVMLRRAGRDNKEGIDYSMAQWYPKMCEYDTRGWHTDPYIGREFYGVWGDYDVSIHIDKKYTVASTGYIQNPEEVGKGYQTDKPLIKPITDKLTWHFKAFNVHDFSWAADPDYIHDIIDGPNGVKLHFFYLKGDENRTKNWKKLQETASKTMAFYNSYVGDYPYKKYSFIQAGDGGMEYAMCTFVKGDVPYNSLRGTVQHEMGHAWFQFSLASNESEYPWMDEGFTSFIQDMANVAVNGNQTPNPFSGSYDSYNYLVKQEKEEPLSTHSDHYKTNLAYWVNAYDKGKLVLSQLGYVMGFDKLNQSLKLYYKNWAMKHPQPDDFFNIAEKVSGMNLKWFKNEWIETTHHIDYKLDTLQSMQNKTLVKIKRVGAIPMPLDIFVIYKDGTRASFYVPLDLTLSIKESNPFPNVPRKVLPTWQWAIPQYEFEINHPKSDIKVFVINPLGMMADIDPDNNVYINDPEK